jgi:hypothetical protein
MLDVVAQDLKKSFDGRLVDELLAAYRDAKHNFYLGGLRLSAVEGGRFCEAAFRMLEQIGTGKFTALGVQINTDKIIATTAQAKLPDGLRIHIPRALRVVYDIRNKRDAAHLAGEIDPNVQDATLVASILDWVLAEFIRLYHGVSADDAHRIINDLVARRAPAVQDFGGFLKILRPSLEVGDRLLLLLYECGARRATFEELSKWVHPKMRKNLKRTLDRLEHELAFVHSDGESFQITNLGIQEVERRKLHGQ